MSFAFEPLREGEARLILTWHYPPPYDFYDMSPADGEAALGDLLNPALCYHAIWRQDEFIGFCCFGADAQVRGGDYAADALDLGIGLRPDWTGRGDGATVISAMLDFARQQFAPRAFRATIADFNLRSRKAFARAGFHLTQSFQRERDGVAFNVLMREVSNPQKGVSDVHSTGKV